jgi:hypothetical protein
MFRALYSTGAIAYLVLQSFVFDFLVPGENPRHPWSFESFAVERWCGLLCSCLDLGSDFDRRF